MEELKGFFVGYRSFKSKSGKVCYIVSLLFISLDEVNSRADYFVKDIFTTEGTYNQFVDEHQLLQSVDVKREIVGDTVRYYI